MQFAVYVYGHLHIGILYSFFMLSPLFVQARKGAISFFNEYGAVGIAVYISIYVISVSGFFVAASSGWLTAEQVKSWVTTLHLDGHLNASTLDRVDTVGGRLFVAWIAAKVIEPLRLFLAVTVTPSVARLLRRHGFKK